MAKTTAKKSTRRSRATQKAVRPKAQQVSHASPAAQDTSLPASSPSEPTTRHWWQRTPKAERPIRPKLPSVMQISRNTYDLLAVDWKLIAGTVLVYGLLNILFVRGLSGSTDVVQLKAQFDQLFTSGWGHVAWVLSVLTLLVSSSNKGGSSDAASAYQIFLLLICSLALVWSFRQLLSTDRPDKIRIRDSFYQGMYPLVPVILVTLVTFIQLIPMLASGLLYSTLVTNGIVTTGPQVLVAFMIFMIGTIVSLRMVSSSILAFYIVSLPGMTPLKALRSARGLVRFRRLTVLRKQLFLPVLLFILLAIILVPFIMFAAFLAQWVAFILTMCLLPLVHAYMYSLYRELLNE